MSAHLWIPAAALAALFALAVHSSDSTAAPPLEAVAARQTVVVGTLTDEGVECQALRSDSGQLYTLTGSLRNFETGDRVRVVGSVAEFSHCQQGITINVRVITRAR